MNIIIIRISAGAAHDGICILPSPIMCIGLIVLVELDLASVVFHDLLYILTHNISMPRTSRCHSVSRLGHLDFTCKRIRLLMYFASTLSIIKGFLCTVDVARYLAVTTDVNAFWVVR